MNKRGGHQKYDAKKMTMRRCIMMDSDLAPRFDEDDEYFSQVSHILVMSLCRLHLAPHL